MPRFDEEKTIAAMLYLTQKVGGRINLYCLMKLIYLADKRHLHEWERTITGSTYARLEHGPTPSEAYDMFKSVRGDQDWGRDLTEYFRVENGRFLVSLVEPDLDAFSDSDQEVLDEVCAEHGHKSFGELKALVHDKAYHASSAHWMTLEDLAEGDLDLIDHLREIPEDDRAVVGF